MTAYKIYRADGEPIWIGTARELADLPHDTVVWFGVWTDQRGHFMLCKGVPAPSYVEITRCDLYRAAA